ncbi:MAG: hypothetical protein ACYTGR_13015 [Planctomycetota bacterium]
MKCYPDTGRGVILFLFACLPLTGCVVTEIHDEMVTTNDRLSTIEQQLELIAEANVLLDDGNQRLGSVYERLNRMESIDATLTSIDASLQALDEHLASLRTTIENIDGSIPFLKFSDGPKDKQDQAESPGTTAQVGSDP